MMNCLNAYRRYACDVDRVNLLAATPQEFIAAAEAAFAEEMQFIAEKINEHGCCIIMLSGPSSSGKTTTAQKLCEALQKSGKTTVTVSLDNFYLGAGNVPCNADNEPDFESVHALDIPYIHRCLEDIAAHKERVILPRYDFVHSRRSDETITLDFTKDTVVVMEGIHALNPVLTEGLPSVGTAKIYASVKQGIKRGEQTILSNRDIRFIRRLVRDHAFRAASPEYMINMWEQVCAGEQAYIRPYRYCSDFTVNTIHIYEPCIMKRDAIPLLEQIPATHEKYGFVQNILNGLREFEDIPQSYVPENSLIREFIGGGCYIY